MNKVFAKVCAGILAVLSVTAGGATVVSGIIGANTTWTAAGSPYMVTSGNLLVDTLVTLTIQPGVVVELDTARCILVKGYLNAIGTASDSIVFTRSGTKPWARLWFQHKSKGHFSYCRIEYANNTAIYGDDADSICVGFCTVSNNTAYGAIGILGGKTSITNSTITGNTTTDNYSYCGAGITVNGDYDVNGSSGLIAGNTLSNNSSALSGGGIDITDASVMVTGNTISHNAGWCGGGISNNGSGSFADTCIISNNTITYNTATAGTLDGGGIYLCGDGGGGQLITFVSNNLISNNVAAYGGGGIALYGGYVQNFATITNNTIINNSADHGGAINITNGSPTIRFNTISSLTDSVISISGGNVGNVLIRTNNISSGDYALCNRTAYGRDLRYNWWNTTNADTLNAKIYDYFDDFTRGIVIYKPVLKGPFGDTTPPPAPVNLAAHVLNPVPGAIDSVFVISWTNPPDPSGIAEYYYKRNSPPTSAFDTTGTFHPAPDTVLSQGGPLYVWLVDSSGNMNYQTADSVQLAISAVRGNGKISGLPQFSLAFTQSSAGTKISYGIPEKSPVSLMLYDISGKIARTLYSGVRESGSYTADIGKNVVTSGIYLVRIKAGNRNAAKRCTIF